MIPEKLKIGDEIRVIAPSRNLNVMGNQVVLDSENKLKSLGFKVTYGKYVRDNFDENYDCGSIEHRVYDLHEAFLDKNVKCILTVVGGFNSNQILDYIDYDLIKNNPKIFCGYSDITAPANAIYAKTGLLTYSGPFFSSFATTRNFDYTLKYFKKMLMNSGTVDINSSKYWSNDVWYQNPENLFILPNEGMSVINQGYAEGTIVGGNLNTLNLLLGTEYMPDLDNTILFLEDDNMGGETFINEFDKYLQALLHYAKGKNIKGIVLGRAERESLMTIEKWKTLINNKKKLSNIPVIANADFGHTTPTFTFPIGGYAKIEAIKESIKIKIKG